MTQPPIALVEWEDAYTLDSTAWVAKQPAKWSAYVVHTVGFILYDGPEGVIVTDSSTHDQTGPRCQIPRGMIHSVTYVAPKPTRKHHGNPTG